MWHAYDLKKYNELLFMYDLFASIMNLFGVLKYKKMGEDFLRESGLPYTIIRFGITECCKMQVTTYGLLIYCIMITDRAG